MWLERCAEWTRRGIPCALVTIVEHAGSTPRAAGAKMVVNLDDEIAGTIGGGGVEHECRRLAHEAIQSGQCKLLKFVLRDETWTVGAHEVITLGDCGGSVTVFVEPIVPQKEIVIFGAGHVGECLARLCETLQIPYRVYDDRKDYVTEARFAGATERIVGSWDHIPERIMLSARSYCVIMTYGHQHDAEVLSLLLQNRDVPYIGMMGSVRKVKHLFATLAERGIVVDGRVYSPIGVGMGRGLPTDIALSILVEVQRLMHGGTLEHLRVAVSSASGC